MPISEAAIQGFAAARDTLLILGCLYAIVASCLLARILVRELTRPIDKDNSHEF